MTKATGTNPSTALDSFRFSSGTGKKLNNIHTTPMDDVGNIDQHKSGSKLPTRTTGHHDVQAYKCQGKKTGSWPMAETWHIHA